MAGRESPGDLVMTEAEFRMFSELVRTYCGLNFASESRYLLEKRIGRRMHELEIPSFAAYHYRLRNDASVDPELARLVDELTTNETYFMRERRQLQALLEEIVPELALRRREQGGGPLNVWSAGCASGEEPYSIVMLALEAGLGLGRDLRVYASDISRPALQKARRGVYREASFREVDTGLRHKYFTEKEGLWRISDAVKAHVDFIHMNLFDRSRIALLNQMDVVLCRNVIIYFDVETKRNVIQTFYEKLRPAGFLLLGHSESLINLSNAFELRHLRHEMVYRRPAPGEILRDPVHSRAAAAISRVERTGGPEAAPLPSERSRGEH
ncbi:MAG TPA: protein-glutamate O-methyltransferase CheR [Myxococcota bacterium]|nr:protein-glutamate O-methyltransferase CheR [Myxococcota bacterium]